MVAITAFEARDLTSLRRLSISIAYAVFVLYLPRVIGEVLDVSWLDGDLPAIYGGVNSHYASNPRTRAIVLIAALQARHPNISGFLNGCLIYSALSVASISLYVSSRTLYGLTRSAGPHPWARFSKWLGTVWDKNGTPMWALHVSATYLLWLPILQV